MTAELIIKEKLPQESLSRLSECDQLYITLYESVRIVNMTEEVLINASIDLVAASYAESGIRLSNDPKESDTQLETLSNILKNDLKQYHRFMTIEEVREAFKRGARKMYGDFMGINISTYTDWINKFRFDKERAEALSRRERMLKPKDGLTKEDKERIFQDALNDCLEYFRKTGKVIDTGGAIFDGLWKRKKIKLTPEQVESYKEQASKNEYERLEHERKLAADKLDRITVNRIDIQMDELMDEKNMSIRIEAKRLSLVDYFKSLPTGVN